MGTVTTALPTTGIDAPGIYPDLTDAEYHADPVAGGSLSSTDARLLLECPARYRYRKDNGQQHRDEFDFGHAAHTIVLGRGADIVVIDADDWRTKDAKTQRDEARAGGLTPILAKDFATVEAMADAIRRHPIASRLLDAEHGKPEQTLIWLDGDVWRRVRLDWLPDIDRRGRLIVPDYKTTTRADNASASKSVANFGYHQQAAWYLDGVTALCGVTDPAFVFIFQEKEPPYLVNVVELDPFALQVGAARNARAIDVYRQCRESGVWPSYSDGVEMIELPRWAAIQHEEEYGVPSW